MRAAMPAAHCGDRRSSVRTGAETHADRPRTDDPPREGLVERYRDWTLDQYAPPRLLVDEHYDVTHVFGSAGDYLIDREGPVTQNVVDKVLRAFRVDLRAALFRRSALASRPTRASSASRSEATSAWRGCTSARSAAPQQATGSPRSSLSSSTRRRSMG